MIHCTVRLHESWFQLNRRLSIDVPVSRCLLLSFLYILFMNRVFPFFYFLYAIHMIEVTYSVLKTHHDIKSNCNLTTPSSKSKACGKIIRRQCYVILAEAEPGGWAGPPTTGSCVRVAAATRGSRRDRSGRHRRWPLRHRRRHRLGPPVLPVAGWQLSAAAVARSQLPPQRRRHSRGRLRDRLGSRARTAGPVTTRRTGPTRLSRWRRTEARRQSQYTRLIFTRLFSDQCIICIFGYQIMREQHICTYIYEISL